MINRRVISYRRVSTSMQFDSGAGLEGQRKIIEDFCEKNGFFLLDSYVEALSGKDENRPMLLKCIEACQKQGASLIVAKLDRLSRRVSFITSFKDIYGIDFIVANLGIHYNKTLIYFLSIMAEYEREAISARVKAGIAQRKLEGTYQKPPGNKNIWVGGKGNKAFQEKTEAYRRMIYKELDFIFERLYEEHGPEYIPTDEELARELNRRGNRTFKQKEWTASNVRSMMSLHKEELKAYSFFNQFKHNKREKMKTR